MGNSLGGIRRVADFRPDPFEAISDEAERAALAERLAGEPFRRAGAPTPLHGAAAEVYAGKGARLLRLSVSAEESAWLFAQGPTQFKFTIPHPERRRAFRFRDAIRRGEDSELVARQAGSPTLRVAPAADKTVVIVGGSEWIVRDACLGAALAAEISLLPLPRPPGDA